MTPTSSSSVPLAPPLVLWSLARQAPSVCDFQGASHFAIHVLAAGQHPLSRRFSTPQQDKFVGLDCAEGPAGVPLIDRKSTRLNSSHLVISYAVFCLKKKRKKSIRRATVPTESAWANATPLILLRVHLPRTYGGLC